ncbi:MAG: MMPL family transporter, partial [Mycobacterium sp.]|nr:MMPL family transporter [Mycobacterium sp.]
MLWDRVANAVAGRRSWPLGLGVVLLGFGFMALIGGNAAAGQAPLSVPPGSDSATVDALGRQFPGGDRTPLIVAVNRADGAALGPADAAAAQAAQDRMQRAT